MAMYLSPLHPMDEFTVLPIQIFNWISRPQHEFTINAAGNNHSINYYVHNEWYKNCIF